MERSDISRFDVSFHYDIKCQNDIVGLVHDEIRTLNVSPYLAWALTLGYEEADLPELLNLKADLCAHFASNPSLSPPPANIMHFCKRLGVHPVYLQPGLHDDNISYHYNVMKTIARLSSDVSASDYDRHLSRMALEMEREKFTEFSTKYSTEEYFLDKGLALARSVASCEVKSSTGISMSFKRSATVSEADAELGLDMLSDTLHKKIVQAEWRKTVHDTELLNQRRILRDLALDLYGPDHAVNSMMEVLTEMGAVYKDDRGFFPTIQWSFENGMISGFSDCDPESVYHLSVRPIEPTDNHTGKRDFLDTASEFVDTACLLEEEMLAIAALKAESNKLENWKDSQTAFTCHLPMFANYYVANTALNAQSLQAK